MKIVQGPPAYIDNHQEEADALHLPKKKQSHKTGGTTVVLILGAPMSLTYKLETNIHYISIKEIRH